MSEKCLYILFAYSGGWFADVFYTFNCNGSFSHDMFCLIRERSERCFLNENIPKAKGLVAVLNIK